MEELVRQQTREFKREIEKRFAISKHNQVFSFPLETDAYSNDVRNGLTVELPVVAGGC